MVYQAYLRTPLWQKIRRRVFARDNGRCRSCGRRATQVHHESYDRDTMTGRTLERLYALCGRCHEAVSLDPWGRKRPMAEQQEWTRALRASKPKKRRGRKRKRRRL